MGIADWFKPKKKQPIREPIVSQFTEAELKAAQQPPGLQRINEARTDSLSPEKRIELGMQPVMRLADFSRGSRSALGSNLLTMWIDAVNDRRAYLQVAEELRRYYIAETILETMAEDALNSNERGEILEFVSEDANIKDRLDELKKTFDFDNMVTEIVEDLITFGEYTMRLEVKEGYGVTGICDDVNPVGVLAFYERGVPSNFMIYMDGQYQIMPANQYAHFVLGGKKERIRLDEAIDPDYQINMSKIDPELAKRLPDYVRVGKPTFFKVISKLRELQILEQLLVALKLNQITQSKFIGIKVPSSMAPKKVRALLDEIEDMLNSQTGLDMATGQVTIADIMTIAGRFKALPDFTDEKGSLKPLDLREDGTVDDLLKTIDNMRQIILSSIGIPYSLIYGMENQGGVKENSRANEIRRYGRYARKLIKIQQAIAKGLKQIAVIHLKNSGVEDVTWDSFDVAFKNTMVDASCLEKMEVDDVKQEMVGRKVDLITKVLAVEEMRPEVNWEGIFEWLEEAFNDLTGGIPLFKVWTEEEEEQQEFDDIRSEFVQIAMDNFAKRRMDKGDTSVLTPDDEAEMMNKTQKVMSKITAAFAARRAKRKKDNPQKEAPKTPKDNLLDMTIQKLKARRKERMELFDDVADG